MEALYEHRISHRDLKRANILVHNGIIKISGFSKMLKSSMILSIKCGTPEVMCNFCSNAIFTPKNDVWALVNTIY